MNPTQKLRTQAGNLWKQICFEKWGKKCELCGNPYLATPHHYYFKGSVPHLRYEVLNGIILCCYCHAKLHFKDAKLVEEEIIKVRGKKWLKELTKLKNNKPKYFKTNMKWYESQIEKLKNEMQT